MRSALALLALAALSGPLAAQTAYRWVDAQGRVHYSDRPPPQEVRQAQELRVPAVRSDAAPGYATSKAASTFPVTLYTAAGCDAPCDKARAFLSARGVPFAEKAIQSEEDVAAYRRLFGEPDEVPAATVGRLPLRGFDDRAWQRVLDEAGYPRARLPSP